MVYVDIISKVYWPTKLFVVVFPSHVMEVVTSRVSFATKF